MIGYLGDLFVLLTHPGKFSVFLVRPALVGPRVILLDLGHSVFVR